MKINYTAAQQFIARIILISLCLQSCSNLKNAPIPIQKEQINYTQIAIKQLVDKQLVSKEGHIVSFYEQEGNLKAEVDENLPVGFSSVHSLPVYIEPSISLQERTKQRRIHVELPTSQRKGHVYIGTIGLMGGSNTGGGKGKEKLKDNEEQEEQPGEDSLKTYQALLELAMEGEAEAQFRIGLRAYKLWKKEVQREDAYWEAINWLEKAAKQEHAGAITLLNELRLPMGEEQIQRNREKIKAEKIEDKGAEEDEDSGSEAEITELVPYLKEEKERDKLSQKGEEVTYNKTEDELELERIESFIAEAVKNTENAQGKDVFLILGKTGAGKSTITNYLLGSKMKLMEDEDLGGKYAITEDPNKYWAEIGHGTNAKTYFPNTYSSPDSKTKHYCDCPGFLENRSEQAQLNTTIATQIMINSAKSIKGIIIVIDLHDLVDGKAEGIKEIGLILSHFLNANIDPKSILFVFNNKSSSNRNLNQIHNNINNLIKVEKEKLNNPAIKGKERERIGMLLMTLNRISNNKGNTFLIDMFDDFESKRQIENKLADLEPAPKESFNFSQYDETRVKFNVLLTKIVGGLSNKLNQYIEATNDIVTYQGRMESSKERINTYSNHLARLNSGEGIQNQEEIQALEQDVQKYIQKLTSLGEKKKDIEGYLEEVFQEKARLDTDEEILYIIKKFKEKRTWLIGSFSRTKKVYKYEGIPYSTVMTSNKKGRFKDPIEQPNEGKYTVTYSTSVGEDEDAKVHIYINRKNHPDNKKRIEQINQELAIQEKRVKEYKEEIDGLNRSREVTQRLVEHFTSNVHKQERELESRTRELELEIARIKREEQEFIQMVIQQEKLKEVTESYLTSRNHIIDSLSTVISHGIGNESALVEHFKELCKMYKAIIGQNPNYFPISADKNFPKCIKCPISVNIFEDPVMSKCGHTFSRKYLLEWLSSKPLLQRYCPLGCTTLIEETDLRYNVVVDEIIKYFEEERLEKNKMPETGITYLSPEDFRKLSPLEQRNRLRAMEQKRLKLEEMRVNAKKGINDIDVLKKLYDKITLSEQFE